MSFFVREAWAQGGAAPPPQGLLSLVPLLIIFVLFYFLLIRPQVKRAKEHRKMVEGLRKGDEVVTSGGLLGRIVEVEDGYLSLEVAEGVRVQVQKGAVSAVLPKGTLRLKGGGQRRKGRQEGGQTGAPEAQAEPSPQSGGEGGSG
ncbi:MAG: preprotein translocase subunit YajC [Gammaproteobacteria bacterium]|nr:MAG: preprotein translocase subunit YajC [Gammaproteobacteria bacterium]